MRKLLLLSVCSAICSYASTMCGANQNVLAQNYSCSYQGLTFSNFTMTETGNVSYTPTVDLAGVGVNKYGEVFLDFNPNMAVPGGKAADGTNNHLDAFFYFTVTSTVGGISGIDLGNNGSNTAITENACRTAFAADNTCSGGLIGQLTAVNSGTTYADSHVFMQFAQQANPVYIFKDINLNAQGSTGAALSSFSQSFAIPGGFGGTGGDQVPEPYTFLTLGGGLIGVALLMKRKTSAQ